jgi:ATP-binding cassette, subfamily B, multidrug efflux pump
LRSKRTSFVIAHRLSTIRDADLILVMNAGSIVEQGTHEELLHNRGPYFDLYNAQFAAAAVDV